MAYRRYKRKAAPAGSSDAPVPVSASNSASLASVSATSDGRRSSSVDALTTECVLQQYMDCIQYLPVETRRSLTLLKDLNRKYDNEIRRLQRLHSRYIEDAKSRLMIAGKCPNAQKRDIVMNGDPELKAEIDATKKALLQLADANAGIAERLLTMAKSNASTLEFDLKRLEKSLAYSSKHGLGVFAKETTGSNHKPEKLAEGSRVAARIDNKRRSRSGSGSTAGESEDQEWILAHVVSCSVKKAIISDFDNPDNLHTIKDAGVNLFPLPIEKGMEVATARRRLPPAGGIVRALYPDTTSFYKATLVTPPYRAARMDGVKIMNRVVCIVTFFGDEVDSDGNLPKYLIGAEYVFAGADPLLENQSTVEAS